MIVYQLKIFFNGNKVSRLSFLQISSLITSPANRSLSETRRRKFLMLFKAQHPCVPCYIRNGLSGKLAEVSSFFQLVLRMTECRSMPDINASKS